MMQTIPTTGANEMARVTIFDLDGTVIDSSHRQITKADGSLDLAAWRANCTPEKIMADKLLPLADHWRELKAQGAKVIVCTARVMQAADFAFLRHHGLDFNQMLARCGENDMRPDAELKTWHLSAINVDFRRVSNMFWDDNDSVREAVAALGIKAKHPRDFK